MTAVALALSATAALAVVFGLLFFVSQRLRNFGFVDVAWSYAFGLIGAYYALAAEGWPTRRAAIGAMSLVWSVRLGTHLAVRVIGHHPQEDGRYAQLRQDWREHLALKMFAFFQMQAVSVVVLGIAFLLIAINPEPQLAKVEITGIALWLLAVTGEAIADFQLAAFKRDPQHRGQVCDVGLWRFSRHPNYFFEWMIWVSFAVFALGSPWGWVGLIGPVSILWLLLRVTGIPMTEEQSIRSRGDAYRRYQATTSAFIPWLPRKTSSSSR